MLFHQRSPHQLHRTHQLREPAFHRPPAKEPQGRQPSVKAPLRHLAEGVPPQQQQQAQPKLIKRGAKLVYLTAQEQHPKSVQSAHPQLGVDPVNLHCGCEQQARKVSHPKADPAAQEPVTSMFRYNKYAAIVIIDPSCAFCEAASGLGPLRT